MGLTPRCRTEDVVSARSRSMVTSPERKTPRRATLSASSCSVRHELSPVVAWAGLPVSFGPYGRPPRPVPEAELLADLAGPYDLAGERLWARAR